MAIILTDEMKTAAKDIENKYGVPSSITLAQITLESSGSYKGGLSRLAYQAKNLFGIKGTGTAGTYHANTAEQTKDGETYYISAGFRKYNTYTESIEDYGKLLSGSRYQKEIGGKTNPSEVAAGLQRAGYATDTKYAEKLMRIINRDNLTQYDNAQESSTSGEGMESPESEGLLVSVVKYVMLVLLACAAVFAIIKGVQ